MNLLEAQSSLCSSPVCDIRSDDSRRRGKARERPRQLSSTQGSTTRGSTAAQDT